MLFFIDSDPKDNPLNEFLKNYGIWIAVAVAVLVFIAVLVLFIIALVKRKNGTYSIKVNSPSLDEDEFFNALGGKDNIISSSLTGSRLSLELQNYNNIDREKLTSLGVLTFIQMSKKIILVFKDDSLKQIKKLFNH